MKRRTHQLAHAAVSALLAVTLTAGCSDDLAEKKPDSGADVSTDLPVPDLPATPDAPVPDLPPPDAKVYLDATGPNCGAGCYDFVLNRILIPTTSSDAQKFSLKYKGKAYNALGNIMALLAQQAPSMGVQGAVDEVVCSGQALHLLRINTTSLLADPAVKSQTWPTKTKCCTTSSCLDPLNKAQCNKAAVQTCFSGVSKFTPSAGATKLTQSGSITAGLLALGPGKTVVSLPLLGAATPVTLELKGATIAGQITSAGVTTGVLAGGIDAKDLQTTVIPALAAQLDKTYKDPLTDKMTKDMIKQLFDTNSDGTITVAEINGNALIKTFLSGDVDLDGDGIAELSVGVGFSAVRADVQIP